jgi:PAS domain S-box-containing protein
MIKLCDYISREFSFLYCDTTLEDAVSSVMDCDVLPVINRSGNFVAMVKTQLINDAFKKDSGAGLSALFEEETITISEIENNEQQLEQLLVHEQEVFPVTDGHGRLTGIIEKVNVLKFLFETYKSSGEKLAAVLNSTHDGIVAIDIYGKITTFNTAAEKLLNFSADKAMGMHLHEVLPGSGLLTLIEDDEPQLRVRIEFNGKTLMSNRTTVKSDSRIVGAVAVFEDITGINILKQTLEETRTAVDVLETILDNTYDGIILVDRNGMITKINRAYQEFLGISEAGAVGRHVTDVIENTRMHIVVESGKPEIGHTQKIHGKEMVVMRIPIFKEGEVVGAVGKVMFRDVRELKSLAENLNLIESELKYYKTELQRIKGAKYSFQNIIGNSPKILKAKQLAKQAAASNSTVLIYGESGTGKEIFAHAIHNYSYRHFGPFVRVNCGAIPATLFESELFGYEKGAFTGADKNKPGKFELANKGTIFLDEVSEIPLEMQVKLLRVLQEREMERVGGTQLIPLDVRVTAASNRPLEELVKEKKFREDLFYRLNIFRVEIPALREIADDIPVIAKHLISELNESMGTSVTGIHDELTDIFLKHNWPGNIRELRNVLERAINVNRQGLIIKAHLPLYLTQKKFNLFEEIFSLEEEVPLNLEALVNEAEKAAILRVLRLTDNNKRQAAIVLGIHRSALYQKIKKHGLNA